MSSCVAKRLPIFLFVTIRSCTFTTLVLVHFQATLFFEITHGYYD